MDRRRLQDTHAHSTLPPFSSKMDFQYVSRTVKGPGCSEDWEEILEGCDCDGPCTAASGCSCLLGAEDNYMGGRLVEKMSGSPVMECHSDCGCNPEICGNRLLQKGVFVKVKVNPISDKGYGVFATDTITKDSFVFEYAGEIIGREEASSRYRENKDHNYIMTVKEICQDKTTVTYVDPRFKGNLARFVNHSCNPNLRLMTVRVGSPVPRVGLFALREITAGEELSFKYGSSRTSGEKKCLCGAEECLGYLPADDL